MNDTQFQEELSIIRNMIARTGRETFERGYLFIVPGIIWLVAVLIMGTLELTGHGMLVRKWEWIMFYLIAIPAISMGLWQGWKSRSQPQTYTRKLFSNLWGACGIVTLLIAFVVPHMNTYSSVVPLMVIGIGFYVTGVIYELPPVQASGVIWWIGMCALGFVEGPVRLPIWLGLIFFGFILPGIVLNWHYRKQESDHGA